MAMGIAGVPEFSPAYFTVVIHRVSIVAVAVRVHSCGLVGSRVFAGFVVLVGANTGEEEKRQKNEFIQEPLRKKHFNPSHNLLRATTTARYSLMPPMIAVTSAKNFKFLGI